MRKEPFRSIRTQAAGSRSLLLSPHSSSDSSSTTSTPLLSDGNFASYTAAANSGPGYVYDPASGPWDFSLQSGVVASGNEQWGGLEAPNGAAMFAFLRKTAKISQIAVGTVAGSTYTLSWLDAGRPFSCVGCPDGENDLTVTAAGVTLYYNKSIADTHPGAAWNANSVSFTANSSNVLIEFSTTNPKNGDHTTFIDGVKLLASAATGAAGAAGAAGSAGEPSAAVSVPPAAVAADAAAKQQLQPAPAPASGVASMPQPTKATATPNTAPVITRTPVAATTVMPITAAPATTRTPVSAIPTATATATPTTASGGGRPWGEKSQGGGGGQEEEQEQQGVGVVIIGGSPVVRRPLAAAVDHRPSPD